VDHPLHTLGDESVTQLFALEKSLCRNKTVYPIEFSLDAEALIKRTGSGLFIEMKHVHHQKHAPNNSFKPKPDSRLGSIQAPGG